MNAAAVATEAGGEAREHVPVVVARSRPFAIELIAAWQALDGTDRAHWLTWKSFSVPAEIYAEIAPRARAALAARRGG